MRKQWVALLSMLGLTGSGIPVQSQVSKGSTTQSKTVNNKQVKAVNGSHTAQNKGNSSKLNLNQQTLRQQNGGGTNGGKQADTMTPSAYCNKGNKDAAKNQLTPPPPGQAGNANAVTKGNANAVTKGNANAVTKGNANAVTKGNANAVTKGNANAVTKGNAAQTAVPK